MSTFIRGVNLSKKWLKIVILAVIAIVCATVITLGVVLSHKENLVILPETNNKVDVLDSKALFSADGLDFDIASQLAENVSLYGDNVALGNAGGEILSTVIKLGDINWTVVYKQNDILTLYANSPVAYMEYGENNEYASSAVRNFLVNEFYPELLEKIGYNGFDDAVVVYGDKNIYYQTNGVQAVQINTLNNNEIKNNDGISGDKIWIPSAYEVGGFANTEYSPKSRVNSFKTITAEGFTTNSGLWNTSNEIRLGTENSWLRSSINGQAAVLSDGIVKAYDVNNKFAVRPCINIVLPNLASNQIVFTSASENVSQSNVLTAGPDYAALLNTTEGLSANARDGSKLKPFRVSKPETLNVISDAVMAGQTFAGKYFKIEDNDIDMSNVSVWRPIGYKKGNDSFAFSGIFDGNSFTISNLSVAGSGLAGLFGYTSGATIQNVGIKNSSWYTTNNNIGSIVGYAVNTTISKCFSDSGIAGNEYVGGLVGSLTSGSKIENCYNLHAVAGKDFIGGLVGECASSSVITSYSAGAVAAINGNSYGGIAGKISAQTVTNCFYYNATSTVNVGTSVSTLENMQNQSTFTGWTFGKNPWFMSNVINDRMPMLHQFMKKATITVKSNIPYLDNNNTPCCTATVNGKSELKDAALGISIKLVATPKNVAGQHYEFLGWYHCEGNSDGELVSTDRIFTQLKECTFTLDDCYNLEARFVRLYKIDIIPIYNGFNNYTNPNFKVTATYNGEPQTPSNNMYREGTIIEITLGTTDQMNFVGMFSKNNQSSDAQEVTKNNFLQVVTANNKYKIVVYNKYPSESFGTSGGDEYYLEPRFNRTYEVTTSVSNPAETSASSTLTFSASGSITNKTSTSKKILYNEKITPTETHDTQLELKSWNIYANGNLISGINPESGEQFSITDSRLKANDIKTLRFEAKTDYCAKTITIKENLADAGKVVLSTSVLTHDKILKHNEVLKLDEVKYNSNINIYILPSYKTGYNFKSISSTQLSSLTGLTYDETYDVYYKEGIKINFVDLAATINVQYSTMTYSISFAKSLEGVVNTSNNFVLSKASQTGLTFASALGTNDYTVTVKESEYTKYFLENVDITIGGITKTLYINPEPSIGYKGIKGAQLIFKNNTSLADLYTKYNLDSAAVDFASKNRTVTVTVNFINITREISVVQYLGYNGGNYEIKNLPSKYNITTKSGSPLSGKAGTGYTLNDEITITAIAENLGYKVKSIAVTNGPSGGDIISTSLISNTFNNRADLKFKLTKNATVTIKYDIRTYNIVVKDNLNTDISASDAGVKINGLGITTKSNTYTYSGNAVPNIFKYGEVITIAGASATFTLTGSVTQKAVLENVLVRKGTSNTLIEYSPVTSFTTSDDLLSGDYSQVVVIFKYKLLQSLKVTFTDTQELAGGEMAALVILKNINNPNDRIVVVVPKNNSGVTVECQVAQYEVHAILPIFIKANNQVSGSTSVVPDDNDYIISIASGAENGVNIDISEIKLGKDSIYGSGIF